jgi:hypothetical protein
MYILTNLYRKRKKMINTQIPGFINIYSKRLSPIIYYFNKHLVNILFTTVSLAFLIKIIDFFRKNPQFYYYWDWPGHIDKARKLDWIFWKGGWDTTFWGGYSTLTYPPLSHYLIKLSLLLNHFPTGLIILSFIAFVLLLVSMYIFSRRFTNNPIQKFILFSILLYIIFMADGKFLGTYIGTLISGNLSSNLGLSLLLLLFSATNRYSRALLMGLLFLTHSLSSLVGLLYIICLIIAPLVNKLFRRDSEGINISDALYSLILSLGIGALWIVPYIDPAFAGSALNIPTHNQALGIVIVSVVLIKIIHIKAPISAKDLLLIILALLLGSAKVFPSISSNIINGLHIYRFQPISLMLTALIITTIFIKRRLFTKSIATIAAILIICLIIVVKNPFQEFIVQFDSDAMTTMSGRFANATTSQAMIDNQHMVEHEITRLSSLLGTVGLFYESSQRGIVYYEFINQINPYSFKNGTYGSFYNDSRGRKHNSFDIDQTAQLLGINYIAYITPDGPNATTSAYKVGSIEYDDDYKQEIFLEKQWDTPLVEALNTLPNFDSNIDLGTWWLETDHANLYVTSELPVLNDINFSNPVIEIKKY